MSFTVHGYTPGRFVTTQMAEMPFLGNSAEATSVALQRVYARTPAKNVPMGRIFRGVWLFVVALVVTLLVLEFESIALWLPAFVK